MGSRQEYITTTKKGLTTLVQAVYVPADDLIDPSPASYIHSFRCYHCTCLIVSLNLVFTLLLHPDYKSLQNIIAILGMDKFLGEDKLTVERACKIQRFMSQPFQVAQVFTGYEGKLVQFKDTVQSFEDSSSGAHDNLLRLLPTWLIQLRAKAEQLAKEMCGSWLDT
ncbi:ATP synthase beta subunit [Pisolithus croceorrhizus]|nr:ATP synthase beta subunit [Pisolithus croceorrhizus]